LHYCNFLFNGIVTSRIEHIAKIYSHVMYQGPTLNYFIIATSQNFEHHHTSVTNFRTWMKYNIWSYIGLIFMHVLIEKSSD